MLSLAITLGASLPAYARLAAGPKAHVCHCETGKGHADCACPICFPELRLEDALARTITGKCGDDDMGWRTIFDRAVAPTTVVAVLAPNEELLFVREPPLLVSRTEPPDPRPPRSQPVS